MPVTIRLPQAFKNADTVRLADRSDRDANSCQGTTVVCAENACDDARLRLQACRNLAKKE